MRQFRKELNEKMEQLRMDPEFARRYVNDGFSGGEMKRAEILQMAMLRPKFAILDETDSGLDVDAVRLASQSIAEIGGARDGHPDHHAPRTTVGTQPPDFTHVMLGGRIVETGGPELAAELHKQGYDRIRARPSRGGRRRSRRWLPQEAATKRLTASQALRTESQSRVSVRCVARTYRAIAANDIMATDHGNRRTRRRPVGEINKYDFRNDEQVRLQGPQGPRRGDRRRDLGDEERARLDAGLPPEEPGDLRVEADAALGRRHRHQLPGHLLLPEAHRPPGHSPGTTCPTEIKNTFDKLGIPEAEKKFLAGVKAQYESEVVYGSLQEELSQAGRDLHRHRLGRPRASRPGARVLRHDHSADRQQVRRPELGRLVGRVVHLRAAGREDRVPACRPTSASTPRTWASSSGR